VTTETTHTRRRLRLPALDADTIRATTHDAVNAYIDDVAPLPTAPSDDDLMHRLETAVAVVRKADEFIKTNEPKLMAASLSYAINEGYAAVYRAAGYSPSWFKKKTGEIEQAGETVPFVEDAHLLIQALAPKVMEQKARREAAIQRRDDAMLALWANGRGRDEIARVAGIVGARLWNIRKARQEKEAA
jgi:hypothetical protein